MSSFFGGRDAGVVKLTADTQEFNARIEAAERHWNQSVNLMSKEALRLDLAQTRLKESLARYGAEAAQTKRATIALKDAEEQATRAANVHTAAVTREERSLGRLTRGAIAGSGAFHGFGRSIAFASSTFLGGAGLTFAIRSSLQVASNLNEQTTKTRNVFGAASDEVIRFARSALGLASDQALEYASTLGLLFRNSGQAEKASAGLSIRLVRLATDMASFNNTTVDDALRAIRSGLTGEIEPLRRYGVFLSEARTKTQALTDTHKKNAAELTTGEKVLARYKILLRDTSLTQGDYARTLDGIANQEREAQKNLRNTQAIIGQALSPAYRDLLGDLNRYLGDTKNQEEIQRNVNSAVRDGATIVKGLAAGLRIVHAAAEPVIDALGGLQKATELALIIGVAAKARKAAASFGLIAAASQATKAKVVADAAQMGLALDAATRPRVVPVTVVQRIGQYGNPIPAAGGAGGRRSIPFVIGFNAPTAVGLAVVSAAGDSARRTSVQVRAARQKYPRTFAAFDRAVAGNATAREISILRQALGNHSISDAPESALANAERLLTVAGGEQYRFGVDSFLAGAKAAGSATAPASNASTSRAGSRPSDLDFEIALERARSTPSTADDLSLLRGRVSYIGGLISRLERDKNKTAKEKENLLRLIRARNNAQDEVDRIIESARSKDQARAAKRRAAAKDAARKEREAFARDVRDSQRLAGEFAKAGTANAYLNSSVALAERGAFAAVNEAIRRAGGGKKSAATSGSFERQAQAFLEQLSGDIRQFASNTRPIIVQNFNSPVSPFKQGRDAMLAARAMAA